MRRVSGARLADGARRRRVRGGRAAGFAASASAQASWFARRSACSRSSRPPVAVIILIRAREPALPAASSAASSSAAGSGSASTRLTRPSASASAASTQRPVMASSAARPRPTRSGSTQAPTARSRPGGPIQRNLAAGPAIRRSAAVASWAPPATAGPATAAITGPGPGDHDFQALVQQAGYLGPLGLADRHVGARAEHVLPGAAQHHQFPGILGEGVPQRTGQGRVEWVVPLRAGEQEPPEAVRAAFGPQPGVRHGHGSPGGRQRPDMLKYGIPNGPGLWGRAGPEALAAAGRGRPGRRGLGSAARARGRPGAPRDGSAVEASLVRLSPGRQRARGDRVAGRTRRRGQDPGRRAQPGPDDELPAGPAQRPGRRDQDPGPGLPARGRRRAADRGADHAPGDRDDARTRRCCGTSGCSPGPRGGSGTTRSGPGARSAAASLTPTRRRSGACSRCCSGRRSCCTGPGGQRVVPAEEFLQGYYTTDAAPDEMITEVWFPRPAGRAVLHEFAQRQGDFAIVAAAVQADIAGGTLREPAWRSAGSGHCRSGSTPPGRPRQPATAETWRALGELAAAQVRPALGHPRQRRVPQAADRHAGVAGTGAGGRRADRTGRPG